jgi:hypothetical protein
MLSLAVGSSLAGACCSSFARRYADQNERDYEAFVEAIGSGRLAVLEGV